MAKSTKLNASSSPKDFEAGLTELENIVTSMEEGKMSLEASLLAHKRGVELLQYCQATLQGTQEQLRILQHETLKKYTTPNIEEKGI